MERASAALSASQRRGSWGAAGSGRLAAALALIGFAGASPALAQSEADATQEAIVEIEAILERLKSTQVGPAVSTDPVVEAPTQAPIPAPIEAAAEAPTVAAEEWREVEPPVAPTPPPPASAPPPVVAEAPPVAAEEAVPPVHPDVEAAFEAAQIRRGERAAPIPTQEGEAAASPAAAEAAEAAARAEAAAEEARRVAAELRAELDRLRNRYARPGPYLGAAALYAFENFDAPRFNIDDSRGLAVYAGYRFTPRVALELRGEILQGFDAERKTTESSLVEASIDGFAITIGPKLYILTGAFQPYVGVGIGAYRAELDGTLDDGSATGDRSTEAVIRPNLGFDFYLAEHLAINVEGAYLAPGGDLDNLDFATVSAGLTFRF